MDTGRFYISAIKVLFLVSLWSGASTQTTTSSTVQSSVTQPTPSLSSSRVDEVIGTTIITDVVTTASGTAMTSPVVEPSTTSGENGTSMTYTVVEASTASGMLNTAEVPNPSSTVQSAGHSAVQGNVQVVLPGAIERQFDDDFEPSVQELQGKITKKVDPTNSKPSDVNVIETLETMIDKGKAILLKYNDSGKSPVDIFNTTKSLVLVMKKFDCISQMKGSLPNRSDHHVAQVLEKFTDGVDLSFECPRIIINASHPQPSSSRKRREVEIELTVDLTEAGPKDEAVFHDSQLLYHHTRFRRNAVEQGCGQSTCDFKRFETSLTVTNRIFNASLSDESSNDYKGLTQNIKDTLRLKVSPSWFHDMHTFKYELANSNNVKSTFYLDVRSSSISQDGVVNALRSALVNETIGDLEVRNETISSIHRVVVDGNYTQWTAWTACDPTPTNYMRSRSRTCNGRQYGGQCYGLSEEVKHCDCGGLMTVGGNITSPLFPNKYPEDIRCEWLLEAPINETVVLNLTEFDLEKDKKCFYDYMEFYEGNTTNETFRIGHRLCGRQGPQVIKSQGQRLLILFKSDKSDSKSGFRVTWETSRTVSEPIKYVEQYVTTLAMIYSPTVNDTHFPLGTATTCSHPSPEAECVFKEEVFIISRFIAALIDRALPLADQNRIVINFEHIMNEKLFPKMYAGHKHCVTWNKTAQGDEPSDDSDPLQSTGGWTRRGCSVLKTNLTHTSCACDHPGLFAVLGQEKLASSKFRLLANTYFGLGISFFILILAIVHIVWKIEIHGGEVMRINMCVAIIVMQSVFLIGAHVKAQQTLCGFLTFAVYFFVLAEFCWLLLHGLRIHGRIKKIFASNLNIEIVYVVIGWGLPLLLALIAIGVQIDLKNPDDVCWKAAAGSAMWGYAAPVIIIALFNMAVLIKLLIPTADVRNNYDYEEMRFRVIKDAIFLAFFGLTCTFAYQAFDKERFLEQYLFSAFVVMQALAMFVLGREGRKDFVKGAEEAHPDNHVTGDEDKPQDPDGEDPHIYESIDEAKGETDLGEGSEKRARKRNPANKTPEKITVTTLKNLNIYKEGGQYVIEA